MGINILLVEDDINISEVVTSYLLDKGYSVNYVFNFKDGLDKIYSNQYDIYILDIMLPDGSGMDLLKSIREISSNPVLIITAIDLEDIEIKSFDTGADDYITKPFSPALLLKRVEVILRRTNKLSNSNIILGNYKIDMLSYKVFYKGEDLNFLTKEFDLFKYLIDNKNIVLSREKILDRIWGYDYFGSDRIVDAHIKNIRKKLPTNIISTIRNSGYLISIK